MTQRSLDVIPGKANSGKLLIGSGENILVHLTITSRCWDNNSETNVTKGHLLTEPLPPPPNLSKDPGLILSTQLAFTSVVKYVCICAGAETLLQVC